MPLIIEDGTGVAGAQAYVSALDAKSWAAARGLTFSGADEVVEQRLLTAMDLLEAYRGQFQGVKSLSSNSLQWPRRGVLLDGELLGEDTIPGELKAALIQLAYEAQTTDLQPTFTGQSTSKEKVDVIEVEYFNNQDRAVNPVFSKALAFLKPLLKAAGSFGVKVLRV